MAKPADPLDLLNGSLDFWILKTTKTCYFLLAVVATNVQRHLYFQLWIHRKTQHWTLTLLSLLDHRTFCLKIWSHTQKGVIFPVQNRSIVIDFYSPWLNLLHFTNTEPPWLLFEFPWSTRSNSPSAWDTSILELKLRRNVRSQSLNK